MTADAAVVRTSPAIARLAAAAATGLPDVARLDSGAVGEIATYGDGERVGGVRIHSQDPLRIEVHVVVRYGRPLPQVAEEVRTVVGAALLDHGMQLDGLVIDVRIGDLDLGGTT